MVDVEKSPFIKEDKSTNIIRSSSDAKSFVELQDVLQRQWSSCDPYSSEASAIQIEQYSASHVRPQVISHCFRDWDTLFYDITDYRCC